MLLWRLWAKLRVSTVSGTIHYTVILPYIIIIIIVVVVVVVVVIVNIMSNSWLAIGLNMVCLMSATQPVNLSCIMVLYHVT